MSNIKELILQKIDSYYTEYKAKFHQNGDSYHLGIIDGLDMAERILDTLEEPVTDCHDLEEAAENPYVLNDVSHAAFEYERTRNDLDARSDNEVVRRAFKAGAEWQKAKMMEEWLEDRDGCFWDGVNEGKKAMEEQMIEGATYNELMELYSAIRDELVKRHRDVPVNIKEEL